MPACRHGIPVSAHLGVEPDRQRTPALEHFIVGWPVPGLVGRWCWFAHADQLPRWIHKMNPSRDLCNRALGSHPAHLRFGDPQSLPTFQRRYLESQNHHHAVPATELRRARPAARTGHKQILAVESAKLADHAAPAESRVSPIGVGHWASPRSKKRADPCHSDHLSY